MRKFFYFCVEKAKIIALFHMVMMNNYGFVRVAACSPEVRPADITYNIEKICEQISKCRESGVDFIVFPELSVTGYTCADLFGDTLLLDKAFDALGIIADQTSGNGMTIIVGAPIAYNNQLFNCGVVLSNGKIAGIVPKTFIPNYGEYYEKRWFCSGKNLASDFLQIADAHGIVQHIPFGTDLLFAISDTIFGIEICEDLWVPNPPSSALCMAGAQLIFNLSATNELIGKHHYTLDLIRNQSARCRCVYVYAAAGAGESSTDLAFAGKGIIAENGRIIADTPRFSLQGKIAIADVDLENLMHDRRHFNTYAEGMDVNKTRTIMLSCGKMPSYNDALKYREIDAHPFIDNDPSALRERCEEISSIQAWGLAIRLRAINCRNAVIGISGGLDSTLALLVTAKAFDMLGLDRKGIWGISMPGFGTTDRTRSNASKLMELLGVSELEIPIGDAVNLHFRDIGHNAEVHDVTYENSQARERTQILMDYANKGNGIVIGTGDLSELALGWCTYNGDQMSMYGVNASIPKTLVKYLVEGYMHAAKNNELRDVLQDIVQTPISPELLPPTPDDTIEQKTEDLVGPYELHDFFMYHMLRFGSGPRKIFMLACKAFSDVYDDLTIKKWLQIFYRRFFAQQFKRSCMPDGIKAGSVCLSPRGDWRMPSDASSRLWLSEIEDL